MDLNERQQDVEEMDPMTIGLVIAGFVLVTLMLVACGMCRNRGGGGG